MTGDSKSGAFINDPAHWRHRAEEMRTFADETLDETSKARMLRTANEYDKLAQRAEERTKGLPYSNRDQGH